MKPFKMNKKRKYDVFIKRDGYGCYASVEPFFVGSTYAVSEQQAINNVRFRNEGKARNFYISDDYLDEGSAITYYTAKLSEEK